MNSPLGKREIRLRGLLPQHLGASDAQENFNDRFLDCTGFSLQQNSGVRSLGMTDALLQLKPRAVAGLSAVVAAASAALAVQKRDGATASRDGPIRPSIHPAPAAAAPLHWTRCA
jgi:hypothetical protein